MKSSYSTSLTPGERALAARLWMALVRFEQSALHELEQTPLHIQRAVRTAIDEAVTKAVLQGGSIREGENPFTSDAESSVRHFNA